MNVSLLSLCVSNAYIESGRIELLWFGKDLRIMVDGYNVQVDRPTLFDFVS